MNYQQRKEEALFTREDLDSDHLQSNGLPVNTAITLGVAEGIVKNED